MPRPTHKAKGEIMEMKQYRLRVMNGFGTLTETIAYFAFTDALQACVKLAKESMDPDYLKKCPNSVIGRLRGNPQRNPLHHADHQRADMFLCVMPMFNVR